MKTLVFGKTGQVATEIARAADVMALGRDAVDLTEPGACGVAIREHKPDVVINAAAYTAVDKAESDAETAGIVNAVAPGKMAEACAALGIPLVHISTDYVFDGSGTRPWREADPIAPLGVYGATKAAGEAAIRDSGCCHAILRTSWVFSAHGANFVKTMLRVGADRDQLRIVNDQVGGPTDARSIARACLTVAGSLCEAPARTGTYHFAGAPDVSWAEFASDIFQRSGIAVDIEGIASSEYPTPAQRPTNSRLDCSAIHSAFGIERPDWRAGLTAVLQDLGALRHETA